MRFSKTFRIFIISLTATITLIVVTSVLLSLYYEKAVIRYMKKYLDEHLLTELSMKDIRFSVLKGFPNAAVEISDVVILSGEDFLRHDFPGSFSDTLLRAKTISFQFDLLKLIHKQYELKKIEVSQGRLNILFDSNNHHNLKIWKTGVSRGGQNAAVNLRAILLNTTQVRVASARKHFQLAAYSQRTSFRGTYSNKILSGEIRGNLRLDSIVLHNRSLIRDADWHIAAKTFYGGDRFKIRQGRLQLNKIVASIAGEYKTGKYASLDLTLGIPQFGLEELMSLLPAVEKALPAHMSFSGDGKLTAVIKGSVSGKNNLFIQSGFDLTGCTAKNTDTREEITNINLRGTISGTRAENFALRIEQLSGDLGKGGIKGSFSLDNLKTLLFRADVQANLDLEALKKFALLDTMESMTGFIRSDMRASGSLKQLSDSSFRALDVLETGTFAFNDAGIKMKNQLWDIRHITGKASWSKTLYLDSLSLQVNGINLLVSGYLNNLAGYLEKREIIQSNLDISTDHFDLNRVLSNIPKRRSASSAPAFSVSQPGFHLNARLRADVFTAGKFKATDVSLHLSTARDSIYVHDFYLKFPDGSITGDALITEGRGHVVSVTCNSFPSKINIQELFTAFNNFTQTFIVDKNVKGHLNGSISFFAQWDSTFKYIPANMKAQAAIEITNGELVQFEPMMRLSKYINVEELRHIRFSTLKNVIYISNRMVTIPEMDIHSTAFNISVSGQHSFDNEFDYRMRVLLSEVLFNRARKKKQEINEFMIAENPAEQTTIPLIIAGTPDKFDVRFDRRRAFDLTRKNLKEDNQGIEKLPAGNDFKIEWEEPESKPVQIETPPDNRQDGSDFKVEWDEDDSEHE
jgi:hypothetical protein